MATNFKKTTLFIASFTFIIFSFCISVETANAQISGGVNKGEYELLTPIPEFCQPGVKCVYATQNFNAYVNAFIRLAIILSAILAVIMIVFGGFQYMTSESLGLKAEGKERMLNAVVGLVLLSASFLILNTINPNILEFRLDIKGVNIKETTSNTTSQTRDERDLAAQGKIIIDSENLTGIKDSKIKIERQNEFRKRCEGRGEFSTTQNGTILQCIQQTEMTP